MEESGNYVGFCSLGLSCQPTENVQLREYFRMRPDLTGVLVSKINPLSDAHKILKKDDIVLAFDSIPIANDGTGASFSLMTTVFSLTLIKSIMLTVVDILLLLFSTFHLLGLGN